MTERPAMIAATPDVDLLSDLLRDVRLSGSVFLHGRFTEPFGVTSPARWFESQPLAHLRHVSVFHLIAGGRASMELPDGGVVELTKEDLVLIPFTPEHRFWNGAVTEFVSGEDMLRPGPVPGLGEIAFGGGGPETRIICGFLESAELLPAPLFRSLPAMLVERTAGDAVSATLAASATSLIEQLDNDPQPGAEAMLGRLMELLFVEVLRRHSRRLPEGARGILAASRDPILARAISALHRDPAQRWTIEDLARYAGASRTVLNERFGDMIGKSPMDYLAGLRMQVACDLLRSTRKALPHVAEDVGYESVAAFSRAFRRIVGVSPGAWREAI